MQTFLPLPDYTASLRCLDRKRLGNQVWREGLTLIRGKWRHHTAARMWRGYEYSLGCYLLAGCDVLFERTGKRYESVRQKILTEMAKHTDTGAPPWLGDSAFHLSHRSNLLRKFPAHYRQFWPDDPDNLPYVWPVAKL